MSTVDALADEMALRRLSSRYAIAADRGDGDMYAGVFLPDGVLTVTRPEAEFRGTSALRTVPALLTKRYDKTFHFVGQCLYEIGEGVASGFVYCQAYHLSTVGQGASSVLMHIRYADSYQRDEGNEWKIRVRSTEVLWTETGVVSAVDA